MAAALGSIIQLHGWLLLCVSVSLLLLLGGCFSCDLALLFLNHLRPMLLIGDSKPVWQCGLSALLASAGVFILSLHCQGDLTGSLGRGLGIGGVCAVCKLGKESESIADEPPVTSVLI